ncbi:MAG: hypothetical protein ACI4VV_06610 [Eggerthellaceae bacterium]
MVVPRGANAHRSPYYGVLQDLVDSLFLEEQTVRRLDVIMAAEASELPEDLQEIVSLLPPGTFTRQRLCDQLNSSINGHAWGQVYGTVA